MRDGKIRAIAQQAEAERDVSLLREALHLIFAEPVLIKPEQPATSTEEVSPELPVMVAEAALRMKQTSVAEEAMEKLFLKASLIPKNQFYARALLVRAQVFAARGAARKGKGLVETCLGAIAFVLQALEVAKSDPRYAFLIYNTSVHYWRISRPLRREGCWQHLVESMPAIVQSLASVEGELAWRVQYMYDLARVYDAAKQTEAANKILTEAATLATKLPDDIQTRVFRLQLHIARGAQAQVANVQKLATTKAKQLHFAIQSARSGIAGDTKAAAAAPGKGGGGGAGGGGGSVADPVKASLEKLLSDAGGAYLASGEAPPAAAGGKGGGAAAAAAAAAANLLDCRLVGELAIMCVTDGFHLPDLAERCVKYLDGRRDVPLNAVVLGEYSKALLLIDNLATEAEAYTRKSVETRVRVLDMLSKSLTTAARSGDAEVAQEGCILIWNVGLPLLQPNLHTRVKKAFGAAVSLLQELDSPLRYLRARLHLEMAKCEVASDLFASAIAHCEAGLKLDYHAPDPQFPQYARPLDRFLQPLYKKLSLKMSLYSAPDREEDKALLLIEQAREAKGGLRTTLLERAANMLSELPPPSDRTSDPEVVETGGSSLPKGIIPEPSEPVDPTLTAEGVKKERMGLWLEICKCAWDARLVRQTLAAAKIVLGEEWEIEKNRDMVLSQAQIRYVQAEALLLELTQKGFHPGQPLPSPPEGAPSAIVAAVKREAEAIQEERVRVLKEITQGMRLALKLKEFWLVTNAGVYIFNYFMPWLKEGSYKEMYPFLEEIVDAFRKIEGKDPVLTAELCAALGEALLDRHSRGEQPVLPPGAQPPAGGKAESSADRVNFICEFGSQGCPPMKKARLLRVWAKARKITQGNNIAAFVPPGLEPESQVIMLLEYVRIDAANKNAHVNKAVEALKGCSSNPELAAKLSQQALAVGECSLCITLAKKAVESAPLIENAVPKLWRWFAFAELMHGKALLQLVDPKTQDKSDQDALRLQAVQRAVQSAKFAAVVPVVEIINCALRLLWTASVPFMKDAASRRVLIEPLLAMVKPMQIGRLTEDSSDDDIEFRVRVYQVLLECLADKGKWHKGLSITESALKDLPSSHQRVIWQARIVFLGNMGQDTAPELLKVKESGAKMAAEAWSTLARSSSVAQEQLSALYSAIDALNGSPVQQVEHKLELAEWLHRNNYPVQDCKDWLFSAADALLDLDPSLEEEEEQQHSRGGSQYKGSRAGSRPGSRAASQAPSRVGRSNSSINPSVMGATMSKTGSFAGKKSGETASQAGGASAEGATESLNVMHLFGLGQIYVMLAKLTTKASEKVDNLLVAQHYLCRTLYMSTDTINQANNPPQQQQQQQPPAATPTTTTTPAVTLPANWHDWIGYSIPDALRKAWTANRTPQVINSKSIPRPEETAYYLEWAIQTLEDEGMDLAAIPLIHLLSVVAHDVVKNPTFGKYADLRLAKAYSAVGAHDAAKKVSDQVGSVMLTDEERRRHDENLQQRLALKQSSSKEGHTTANLPPETPEGGAKPLSSRRMVAQPQSSQKVSQNAHTKPLLPIAPHVLWMKFAKLKMDEGDTATAAALLSDALEHARAFDDLDSVPWVLHYMAQLAVLAGDNPRAIDLEKEARAVAKGDLRFWLESTTTVLDARGASTEGLGLAEHTIYTLNLLGKENPNLLDMSKQVIAAIRVRIARAVFDQTLMVESGEIDSSALGKSEHYLGLAVADFKETGAAKQHALALQTHGDILLSYSEHIQEAALVQKTLMRSAELLAESETLLDEIQQRTQPPREAVALKLRTTVSSDLAMLRILRSKVLLHLGESIRVFPHALTTRPSTPDFPRSSAPVAAELEETIKKYLDPTGGDGKGNAASKASITQLEAAVLAATQAVSSAGSVLHLSALAQAALGTSLFALARAHGMFALIWRPLPVPTVDDYAQIQQLTAAPEATTAEQPTDIKGKKPMPTAKNPKDPAAAPMNPAVAAAVETIQQRIQQETAANIQEALAMIAKVAEERNLPPLAKQASDTLVQAINSAREAGLWNLVGECSLCLASMSGTTDNVATAESLTLWQSCSTRQWFERVLSCAQPSTARESVLLRQLSWMFSRHIYPQNNPFAASSQKLLENLRPRLQISQNIFQTALSGMPPTTIVLSMALHSFVGEWTLIGSIAGGCQGLPALEKEKVEVFSQVVESTLVHDAMRAVRALPGLVKQYLMEQDAKTEASSTVDSLTASIAASRKGKSGRDSETASVVSESSSSYGGGRDFGGGGGTMSPIDIEMNKVGRKLGRLLQIPLDKLNRWLQPALGKDPSVPIPPMHILLVLDGALAELPIESAEVFQAMSKSIRMITRDFSLQLAIHRAAGVGAPTTKPVKKISFSYLIDPRNESKESVLTTTFKRDMVPIIKEMTGISGADTVPSPGDLQRLFAKSSAFVFYSMGVCLSHINPQLLSPLQLKSLHFAMLCDNMHNDASHRRQSKVNNSRSPLLNSLESSVRTAALLSARGVNSVLCQQWATDNATNTTLLKEILTAFTTGKSHAEIVWKRVVEGIAPPGVAPGDAAAAAVMAQQEGSVSPFSSKVLNPVVYGIAELKME